MHNAYTTQYTRVLLPPATATELCDLSFLKCFNKITQDESYGLS